MNETQREAATATWQAYNAMETTKRRHFDYLSAIEARRNKFNLEPSELEDQMLARFLRDHDEQVKLFKTASQMLREHDLAAFDALWAYINEINGALAAFQDGQTH